MGAKISCSKANARRKNNAKRKARRVRCETNTLNRKMLRYEKTLRTLKTISIAPPPPRGCHPAWIQKIKDTIHENKMAQQKCERS